MKFLNYLIASTILILNLSSSYVHASSKPLTVCSLTKDAMSQGMGGSNQMLGYSMNITGSTVELILSEPKMFKGLFMFAMDENGKPVGTWSTQELGFEAVMSTTCPKGAITHSDGNVVKQFITNPKFTLSLPSTVQMASIKAFVVNSKTAWQEVGPIMWVGQKMNSIKKSSAESKPTLSFIYSHSLVLLLLSFVVY